MTESKVKSNSVMTWKQVDGKLVCTVVGVGDITFDPDKASAVNRARAMMHGFKQRLADGAALVRDTETGLPATAQEKFDSIKRLAVHYESGSDEWALRVAEPKTEGDGTWLCKALVALGKARDIEHAEGLVVKFATKAHAGQMGPARKALLAASDIRAKVLELKAAAVPASKVSADDLLADLEGGGGPGTEESDVEDAPM